MQTVMSSSTSKRPHSRRPKTQTTANRTAPTSQSSKRVATGTATSVKQNAMRGARKALVKARQELRNQVCVPENDYPGKPSDYTVVPNFCVKKKAPGERQVKVNKDGAISAEATRREIKILETELAKYPRNVDANISAPEMEATIGLFSYMLAPRARIKLPDPNSRYLHFTKDATIVPARKIVFSMLLQALRTMV